MGFIKIFWDPPSRPIPLPPEMNEASIDYNPMILIANGGENLSCLGFLTYYLTLPYIF
jgi:hypothetical protein